MKRYAMKDLERGTIIEFKPFQSYERAPRVVSAVHGEILGYIARDIIHKLVDADRIVKIYDDYWTHYYIVI